MTRKISDYLQKGMGATIIKITVLFIISYCLLFTGQVVSSNHNGDEGRVSNPNENKDGRIAQALMSDPTSGQGISQPNVANPAEF